jgi:phage-related protein (TIGR01555 family)
MAKRSATTRRYRRQDGWVNPASGHGTDRDRRMSTDIEIRPVLDQEGLSLWRSDDILARIANALPFDAWRRGCEVKVADDGKELSDAMSQEMDRLAYTEKMRWTGAMERALGGAAIFPIYDGDVGDFSEPLDLDTASIRQITALHILEPRELVPVTWYADLTDPRFRYPETYRFVPISVLGMPTQATNIEIHESRLILFDGVRTVPHHTLGQRVGWGDSVYMVTRQVAADFGLAWGSAAHLLSEFARAVYGLEGLHDMLARKDGESKVRNRIAFMDELASTIRATVIDGKDKFERQQTPVSGLSDLLVQLSQRVAAAAEMPVTRLMGMSPAGLNATGESDIRTWYDSVEVYRRRITPQARKLLRMMWLQGDGPSQGVEPERWSLDFPPLWQPTEKEVADARLVVAQADKIYAIDIGAVSPATIAKSRWGGDSYSPEMHVDEDVLEAMEQHEQEMTELEQEKELEQAKNPAPPPIAPGAQPGQVDPAIPPKTGAGAAKAMPNGKAE